MSRFIVEDYSSKFTDEEDSDLESVDLNEPDSDVELQDALLSGRLKPGLHAKLPFKTKVEINNVNVLESKLNDFKLNANWIERLDVAGDLAELPDHIPNPLKDQNATVESNDLDVIRNDIKREIKFMLQAKSSVHQCLSRLHALKVKTRRPDDYLAEMLKSKEHMDKVQKVKDTKKELIEKKEKAKVLREQKKMGKKIQNEVLMQRQKEKKEFQEKIKKFRKGGIKSTDFLDDRKDQPKGGSRKDRRGDNNTNKTSGQLKRNPKLTRKEFKASKFGYGGRKKGTKKNTSDSSASFGSFKAARNSVVNKGRKRRN